jgi:hypothetical protein
MSTRFLSSVMTCGVLSVVGCAAAQVDEPDNDSGSGATSSTAGKSSGTGGGGSGGTGVVPKAGSSSAAGSTSSTAGTGSGGTGTAGSTGKAGSSAGGSGGSPPTKPADTNLPYSEDFEDGEPNGFIPWNEDLMAGTWSVVDDAGGKIYQPAAAVGELEFAVGGSTSWTDVAFTVKVRLADADSRAHIVLRMKEPKTYLVVEMAEGAYKLRGRADGSTTDLVAPSPKPVITAGTWHTVGITAKGSAVELTLDGVSIGTGTANALISNGGIALGVAEGSVAFDDVSVVVAP